MPTTPNTRPRFHTSVRKRLGDTLSWGGIGVFVSGIGVLGYQSVLWLRDGFLTTLEFRLALRWLGGSEPAFNWLGVQKIAQWVLEWPLSLGLMVMGILLVWIGASEANAAAAEANWKENTAIQRKGRILSKLTVAGFFGFDKNRPGKPVFRVGALMYVLTFFSISILGLVTEESVYGLGLLALFAVPFGFIFLGLALAPTLFMVGYVTGTPIISFQSGLRQLKRHFRSIIGVLLILGSLTALTYVILRSYSQ